jgi:hypothetical protein
MYAGANGGKTTNHHVLDAEFKRNIENIKLLYKKIALRNSLTCLKSMTHFISNASVNVLLAPEIVDYL